METVPGMVLTHPPPAPPGLEHTGQPGEKKVSCDNPTEKGEEEGHTQGPDSPLQGAAGQRGAVPPAGAQALLPE